MNQSAFRQIVYQQGRLGYRPMPWRDQPTLYYVLVSELMLQQTQVARVLPKFTSFVATFPDIQTLAAAELRDVLTAWQGLGYNRRAKYLHQAVRLIAEGAPVATLADLVKLPGVGTNTAGAILNYVYQIPTPFIETNIRTVYFNHFFRQDDTVSDREVLKLVDQTIDRTQPRQWFWALMDYGTRLKADGKARLAMSRQYRTHTPFQGSVRQMRGEILRYQARGWSRAQIVAVLSGDPRFASAIESLQRDGLLYNDNA